MSVKKILSKTEEYLGVPSVVRYENPFMEHLADDFNSSGYEVEKQDRIVVVKKKGLRSPKIVTAHIDRHGIVVNSDGNFEYGAYNAKKHYGDENKSSEGIFKKSGQRFLDELVWAYDPKGQKLAEGKVIGFNYDFDKKDLLFDIDGLEGLPQGVAIAYVSPLVRAEGNVSSQIDNAISVAVAYQLVQDGFDGTLVFATEEEIGRSWQHIKSYLSGLDYKSQELFTLDTTPYNDTRAIQKGLVVLRNKDESGVFNPNLVSKLKSVCKQEGINYECKDEVIEAHNAQLEEGKKPKKLGRTELGRIIQHTNGDFNGATIQLPTTNYHSNHEATSELALANFYNALTKLI